MVNDIESNAETYELPIRTTDIWNFILLKLPFTTIALKDVSISLLMSSFFKMFLEVF